MKPLALIRALRPHQWSKNVFVLAPLVFAAADRRAEHQIDRSDVIRSLVVFAAFCLASSAVYLLNDVMDVESDRAHPKKCKRPIASGQIPIPLALTLSTILGVVSLVIGFWAGGEPISVSTVLGLYLILNLSYSWRLKRVVLVDVFCIATGFLFRVKAGGLAANAEVSHWLFLCTFLLALFLGFNKRRAELVALGEGQGDTRPSLREYSVAFLDQMTTVLAACTIVCYALYTLDPQTTAKFGETNRLVWTVPFVAFGIARYMLLVQNSDAGEKPTKILLGGDALFLLNLLGWAGVVVVALFVF
jgi:4-hydroxybenzoate polyprenyltransferase